MPKIAIGAPTWTRQSRIEVLSVASPEVRNNTGWRRAYSSPPRNALFLFCFIPVMLRDAGGHFLGKAEVGDWNSSRRRLPQGDNYAQH
jgi:hypothetical protein